MTHDEARQALETRIAALRAEREAMAEGSPERGAAAEAIRALRREIDRIDVAAADALAARIGAAAAGLEAVLAAHDLGPASAVARAARALRDAAGGR